MAEGDNRERTWQAGPVRVRVTLPTARPQPRERKEPLTTDRIVDAALGMMRTDGYDAVSMRSLARTLASLRVGQHVQAGDLLGFVGDQRYRSDHAHIGVTSPKGEADAKARITAVSKAPRVT